MLLSMNALSSLKAEMKERGVGPSALAAELKVSKSLVSMWLNASRRPGLGPALGIEQWSEGRVPASAWPTRRKRRPSSLHPPAALRDHSPDLVVRRSGRRSAGNRSKHSS